MSRYEWTRSDEERLRELYPYMPNREIAKIFGVSTIAINHKARRLGLSWSQKRYRIQKVICDYCGKLMVKARSRLKGKHHFCSQECYHNWKRAYGFKIQPNLLPSPALAYLCGVLFGDGTCCKASQGRKSKGFAYVVALEVTEKQFAQSFLKALRQVGLNPRMYPIEKSGNRLSTWYVKAYSKKFYEWWIRQTLFDFQKMFFEEEKILKEFIRGFYESEGSYYKYDYQSHCQLCNTDHEIILLFQKALSQFSFETSIYRRRDARAGRSEFLYTLYFRGGQREHNRFIQLIKPCIKNSLA